MFIRECEFTRSITINGSNNKGLILIDPWHHENAPAATAINSKEACPVCYFGQALELQREPRSQNEHMESRIVQKVNSHGG